MKYRIFKIGGMWWVRDPFGTYIHACRSWAETIDWLFNVETS